MLAPPACELPPHLLPPGWAHSPQGTLAPTPVRLSLVPRPPWAPHLLGDCRGEGGGQPLGGIQTSLTTPCWGCPQKLQVSLSSLDTGSLSQIREGLKQCSSGRKTTLKNVSQIVLVLCQHPSVAPRPTCRTSHSLHTVQRTQSVRACRRPTSLPLTHSLQPRQPPCAVRMFQTHSHLGLIALAVPPAPR